jgi:flagellar motility protein MotE (MotC chaperone)
MVRNRLLTFLFLSCACWATTSAAEDVVATAVPTNQESATDYCTAFADKAAESKTVRQRKELVELKGKIEEQLLTLDEKTKSLEVWIEKRESIREAVSMSLVKMYANVEAEIAAQQIQKLDASVASELLRRLSSKQSGEILSSMDVAFASVVVSEMLSDAAKMASNKGIP